MRRLHALPANAILTNSDRIHAAARAELRMKTDRATRLSLAGGEALTPILREAREEERRTHSLWEESEARGDISQANLLRHAYELAKEKADTVAMCQREVFKAGAAARGREMDGAEAEYVNRVNGQNE